MPGMRHAIPLLALALALAFVDSRLALASEDPAARICAELYADSPSRLASLCTLRAKARPEDVASWNAAILALHRRLGGIDLKDDASRMEATERPAAAAQPQEQAQARATRQAQPAPAGTPASPIASPSLPATKLPGVAVPALEHWIETRCDFTESIWCRLEPSVPFAEVMWPTPVTGDPRHVPPTSLFWSYSTMTFNGRSAFLWGGGHAAYDGNEVYEFDFATLEWRRLSDPEPLTGEWLAQYYPKLSDRNCLWPDNGLAAGHAYDNTMLEEDRLHVWASSFSCGKWSSTQLGPGAYGIYDLAQGRWVHREPILKGEKGWPTTVPATVTRSPRTGRAWMFGAKRSPYVFEVELGANHVRRQGPRKPGGWLGQSISITIGDAAYLLAQDGIWRVTLDGFTQVAALPGTVEHADGMRYDGQRLTLWDGGSTIYTTQDFKSWKTFTSERGPQENRFIYNKFFYFPAVDAFVVYTRHDEAWIARLPEQEVSPRARLEAEGYQCADSVAGWECPRLQSLIARGGEVKLPKGIYRQCATVKTPLTLDGNGSHIRSEACAGKAALVTDADTRIRNLTCSDIRVGDGNGACVRQQAASLELVNVVFRDSQSGVLTSPAARRLTVRNSVFSGLGGDCAIKCGRAHGIYFVAPDGTLAIENSRFDAPRHQAHLIKSGAAKTLITDSVLDETEGQGSRIVDVFNGGELIIRGSDIRNARGGNTEVIGYDYEARADHAVNRLLLERLTGSCAGGRLVGGRNSLGDAEITLRDNGLTDCR